MLRSLFKRGQADERPGRTILSGPKIPRHSSGWTALLKDLRSEPGQRVLDIGPTSPQNINLLTGLGQSVYMADIVRDALDGGYEVAPREEGAAPGFDAEAFFAQNSGLQGREFDVVLLWATLDYIPDGLVAPLIERLRDVTAPGARILAIFHSKAVGPYTNYCRYHLTETDEIQMQESEPFPVRRVYTNRSIENLFSRFSNYRFFLAKDNLYEVLITR